MKNHIRKILVAVDGSENAFGAVRYVSKIPTFQEMQIVLFHVFTRIPQNYWDLEGKPLFGKKVSEVRAWEMQNEKIIREFMEKAKILLLESGVPEENVAADIHERQSGIARDILSEAQQTYCTIVIGRKGTSKLTDIVFGGVADKLIRKLAFVPLLVVGDNPTAEKILLGFDGSEGAMQAVDYVGNTLRSKGCMVQLTHVIRGKATPQDRLFLPEEYVEEAKKEMIDAFDKAKRRMIRTGFEPHQITMKTITGASSRAGAIVEESKNGGFDTIVVGRRGLSKINEFLMGSVSNKVLHLAKKNAVFIVT